MADKIKICLDAGHYGKYNRSPAVPEYYESDMTWKLHKKLKKRLEGYGFEVSVTREKKAADRALYYRGYASKGCDLFISLHSNAVGSSANESVDRVDVYAPLNGSGHDIARKLADVIAETMGTKQKGYVKTRKGSSGNDYYGVIRGATAAGTPGLLVEHSFHTCTRSAKWLLEDKNLDMLAEAEARVLAEHFGLVSKTPIMGEAGVTAAQMRSYIKKVWPDVPPEVTDMIPLYISEGRAEGIRGDVAFAQSCLETGNFRFAGSAVTLSQNNFCGLGVTKAGEKGCSFDTPQLGIRAQIQHLKAYAGTEPLKNPCVDPRFTLVDRGCAKYVEWLGIQENPNGKGWAAGAGYGAKILAIMRSIAAIKADELIELGDRTLIKGMTGPDVRALKEALIVLGYSAADDEFDAATEDAVNRFKADNGLEANGKAGSGVFRRINEYLSDRSGTEDVEGGNK